MLLFLLDLFFPKRCVSCGKIGEYICVYCQKQMHPIRQNETICPVCERPAIGGFTHLRCTSRYTPDGLWVPFHYDGPIKALVHAAKYRSVSDLCKCTAYLLFEAYENWSVGIPKSAMFVPIPLHKTRIRERGFNQAECIGKHFAFLTRSVFRSDIVIRTVYTPPQAMTHSKKERIQHLRNAFALNPSVDKKSIPKDVILFDDVFTTGATARAACETLKRSGVQSVWIVTLAR